MAMVIEDNKALVRRFINEVFNERNQAAIAEFLAPNEVDHTLPPGLPPDRSGTEQGISMFLKAFPDLRITIDEMIADEDKVVIRYTSHGSQRGPFWVIPPLGREITVSSYLTCRISNGKIVEMWGLDDQLGTLQQLGVIPMLFGFTFLAGLGAGLGLGILLRKLFA
ncbi:MAG TPA: ester cyclase [Ktedonobacterales bacterium]|nr:ester cyclase [Ktedonobacterales bacterium]